MVGDARVQKGLGEHVSSVDRGVGAQQGQDERPLKLSQRDKV